MEVKSEYLSVTGSKDIEVRLLPTEWETKRLEDLGAWKGGMTPSMNNPSFWLNGTIPWISSGDVKSVLLKEAAFSITAAAVRQRTTTLLPSNSIIVVTRSGILRKYLPVAMNVRPMAINQDIKALIPSKKFDPFFLLHLLIGYGDVILGRCMKAGTTVESIELRWLKAFAVPIPPLSEQRAIAKVLTDMDALLEALERVIAKKRDIKQAAMQQLLTGQTRLPGFQDEWEERMLGDLGPFLKGSGVKKEESRSGNLPCIRYGEIYTHHDNYVTTYNSWISPEVAANATLLKQGDLLFAGSGETKEEIGKCVAIIGDGVAYAGGDIVILRQSANNAMFLGYYCNTTSVIIQKASRGQGDAVVHISASALSTIEVKLPGVEEQTAIATVLSDMDAELAALEQRLTKTRALKQGMMQELLTGRTRLV